MSINVDTKGKFPFVHDEKLNLYVFCTFDGDLLSNQISIEMNEKLTPELLERISVGMGRGMSSSITKKLRFLR